MFNPKDEVPSLELCKKLKELEFPQESGGWYWIVVQGCKHKDVKWELKFYEKYEDIPYWTLCYKAPTVRELGEWLPADIEDKEGQLFTLICEKRDGWIVAYYNDKKGFIENIFFIADTEAEARVKMLIWLVGEWICGI